MIEWLKTWTNQVIVAIMIAIIFELILPNGKNKKYIKMVINLYVLFVLISPVISKISGTNGIDLSNYDYENYLSQENLLQTSSSVASEDIIKSTYEQSIKSDIKNKLLDKGYNLSSISIDIDTSNDNYGKINYIKLTVSDSNTDNNTNDNTISISVNQINISENSVAKEEKSNIRKKDIENIKNIINEEYGISAENIEVN